MKLSKLIVQNFRGLKGEPNEIDFSNSDIIFLLGQNNVGKSTYLRAYEFFTNAKQAAEKEDFHNHTTENNTITIEGWFIKEDADEDDTELQGKGKEKDAEWISKWVGEDGFVKIRKEWKTVGSSFEKFTYSPSENKWVQNGFGGMDTLFAKYSPTPIVISAMEDQNSLEKKVNDLLEKEFVKKIKETYPEKYEALITGVKELQSLITGSESVESLNADLNKHFQKVFADLTLKIQATKDENIKIEDAFKKNHSVIVERKESSRKETFLQNGHGVIRQALFNFLTFLKRDSETSRKQYLILFEEPEVFLHPKIAFKLRESLYELAQNSPYQIICATHSPLMIDISKPHSSLIRVVKNMDETTTTFQIGEDVFGRDDEQKERVQMINRFNPHICEAFYADKVLLVEGDTETIVYRDILNRYYPNEEIFVLNTGSKNNIPFFQEILTRFQINHFVIHDTDTEKSSNGNNNPAWTLNQTIWTKIEEANSVKPNLARRYVHTTNFETAHNISLSGGKDKPLKAFQFVKSIDREKEVPDCLKWLDDIVGKQEILHNMDYITGN
ncbi:AAA family ATPase [Parabacteroides sp. PF5-6]|uniref:ATP-dependent nuclease n=1 Tax=Parabacteroides sp. PF5-6 TaxID=1742403 RepID=UPI00240655E3|nr:AAA family ATPase [Parabacteroides sp. PF5-6]MDF9830157.1 putative ATP-dependent endonuclease of OLD family [Parabacteroides sp. PF5-6]